MDLLDVKKCFKNSLGDYVFAHPVDIILVNSSAAVVVTFVLWNRPTMWYTYADSASVSAIEIQLLLLLLLLLLLKCAQNWLTAKLVLHTQEQSKTRRKQEIDEHEKHGR